MINVVTIGRWMQSAERFTVPLRQDRREQRYSSEVRAMANRLAPSPLHSGPHAGVWAHADEVNAELVSFLWKSVANPSRLKTNGAASLTSFRKCEQRIFLCGKLREN